MSLPNILVLLFVIMAIGLSSCSKDDIDMADFCEYVNTQEFEKTELNINDFLNDQKGRTEEESMDALKQWLEGQSCVSTIGRSCVSCMKSFPPQSFVEVKFISDGAIVNKIVYISMTDPPQFKGYN